MPKLNSRVSVLILFVIAFCVSTSAAQTSSFTYQGRLTDGGTPANGTYDLQFKLYDTPNLNSGSQIGLTLTFDGGTGNPPAVPVTNGVFTVQLDFGANAFPGANRFLEIGVKHPADSSYTSLDPRQQLTSTPYAVRSLNATTADTATNATQLGGVAASQYVQTNDSRLSDSRSPTAGSSNYIQNNPASTQSGSFNISGNGTAGGTLNGNIVNATTQFSIAGLRVLSVNGPLDQSIASNTFVGAGAGLNTTPDPIVFGGLGKSNSFFGADAGRENTSGYANSFFGTSAGARNIDGLANSFFGEAAGKTTIGSNNSFFGVNAGVNNSSGGNNSFFGVNAGTNMTAGGNNSFFGVGTDFGGVSVNTTGNDNTLLGYSSKVTADLSNQTAIGAKAKVTQSNSLVLGSINGTNGATADTNVGIGTTAPSQRLHVVGNSLFTGNLTVSGTLSATLPSGSGNYIQNSTSQQANSNFNISGDGTVAGHLSAGDVSAELYYVHGFRAMSWAIGLDGAYRLVLGASDGSIGTVVEGDLKVRHAGIVRATVNSDSNAGLALTLNNQPGWSVATATGGQFQIFNDAIGQNAVWIDSASNKVGIGTPSPDQLLSVNGNASKVGGGSWATFSDERLKNIKGRFTSGLKAVMQLHPIRYEYKRDNALNLKSDGEHIGFSAQAVQKIIPEAVIKDDKGYLLVNNDPIMWTMLNAIKEQQQQIEQQQKKIATLMTWNTALNARLRGVEKSLKKRAGSARQRRQVP